MRELIEWIKETLETQAFHLFLTIAIFVVVFLQIHSFQDDNGRSSSILTTFLLMRKGYIYIPYSSLESIIEQN